MIRDRKREAMKARSTAAVLAAALLLGASSAMAQAGGVASHAGDPGGDTNTTANRGSPLPGGGTTKDLTMPGQGGVADTGLGGSTNGSGNGGSAGRTSGNTSAGLPGTGMSVKGPAGQGLDGEGVPNGSVAAGAGGSGK